MLPRNVSRACVSLLLLVCHVAGASSWTSFDEESLIANMELDEFDFDEMCNTTDKALKNNKNHLWGSKEVLTALTAFATSQRMNAEANAENGKSVYPERTEIVARKLELMAYPGDVALPAEKYVELLSFEEDVSQAITQLRVTCEASLTCSLTSRDHDQLLAAWQQTSSVNSTSFSSDLRRRYADSLLLTRDAAHANGFPDVESYWLMLGELEADGYQKARTLWSEIRPLYQKLHRWVAKSLIKKFGPDVLEGNDRQEPATRIPAHLLGSRLGADWTNIADIVLVDDCKQVYEHIVASLQEKQVVGKTLYQKAEKMTKFLGIGKLNASFWDESVFDSSCPTRYINPCHRDPRVATCNIASWTDYLDGHEITMRSVHSQLFSAKSQGLSYLLQNANRFSSVEEGVAGLATLIAANRHYLAPLDLLNLPKNRCVKDALFILLALRILPRLPYYLVADLARLEAVKTNRTADIGKIWSQMREDDTMQGVSTPEGEWWGFLEDPHIVANKPYIGHFYGVFVQFQLFGELLMSDASTSSDAEEFIRSRDEFRTLLQLGMSRKWPELLHDTFGLTKVRSSSLLRFFERFETLITPFSQVPKDSRTSRPVALPADNADQPEAPKIEVPLNSSTDAAILVATNATTDSSSEEGAPSVIHYVLIACGAVAGVLVVAALACYGRKYMKKKHLYQRPVNQPA